MNIIAELTVTALRPLGGEAWVNYRRALIRACRRSPPPFGTRAYGDIYRDAASDPHWLASSLMANAAREGEGAGQLWDLAACTADAVLAGQIAAHAIDESGHARAYIALLDLVFPGAVGDDFHTQLVTLSPGYTRESRPAPHDGSPFARPATVDDLIQMNIAEIRTRVHHLLQRPMLLLHYAPDRRDRLVRILDTLLIDETRHIAYTAALIETFARSGRAEQVSRLMEERLADFNAITMDEVGRNVFAST